MARFVKLTHVDGHTVYVNPDHVVQIRPSVDRQDPNKCTLTLDNGDHFVVKGTDVADRLRDVPIND